MHKFIFHIPCCKYQNGTLTPAPWQQVVEEFSLALYKYTDGFYITDAIGCYKGRSYPEKLVTAYCDAAVVTDFLRIAHILQQEAYAYEMDGELVVRCN